MTEKNEALALTPEQIKQMQEQLHAHTGRAIAERDARERLEAEKKELQFRLHEAEEKLKSADK